MAIKARGRNIILGRKYIIIMVASILVSFGTGYMTKTCVQMIKEINKAQSEAAMTSYAQYTMVACNDNTAILVKNGEVEGDTFISADLVDVRINNGMVEWFDGSTWNKVALVEQLQASDKFKVAKEQLAEFESNYVAESSQEGLVDKETVASLNVGDLSVLKEEQSSWMEANSKEPVTTKVAESETTKAVASQQTTAPTKAPQATAAPTQPATTAAQQQTTAAQQQTTAAQQQTTAAQQQATPSHQEEQPAAPSHSHSYSASVQTASTCTSNGVMRYTCSCGDSYTQEIGKIGHNYSGGHCTACGADDPDYHVDPPTEAPTDPPHIEPPTDPPTEAPTDPPSPGKEDEEDDGGDGSEDIGAGGGGGSGDSAEIED